MQTKKIIKKKQQNRRNFFWGKRLFITVFFLLSCLLLTSFPYGKAAAGTQTQNLADLTADKIPYPFGGKNISGSYGNLQLNSVILQAPLDYFLQETHYDSVIDTMKSSSRWIFRNLSLKEVNDLFNQAAIKQEVVSQLLQNTKPDPQNGGFVTSPPDTLLWKLTIDERSRLYTLIGQQDGNPTYAVPYHFSSADPGEWVYKSSLPKGLADKLKSLIYVQDGLCLISDLHLMSPYLKTKEDWSHLLQTIFRSPSVDAYLKISRKDDIKQLAAYWGSQGRDKSVLPLLAKVQKQPGGGKINISTLFPPIAQNRLGTFTTVKETYTLARDCKWTMFNFFNTLPDERFYSTAEVQQYYFSSISRPAKSASQLKFGDIIYIYDRSNTLLHTCTYIANNLVYTKNGQNCSTTITPFMLSSLDQVMTLYNFREGPVSASFSSRSVGDTHQIAAAG